MTFVNQYTKPRLNLRNAAAFSEYANTYVYGVGHVANQAVVIKTNVDGSTVWTRGLTIKKVPLRFYDIIQVRKPEQIRYVIIAYNNKKFYLVCISDEGQKLWIKEVVTQDADSRAFIVATPLGDEFYLAYSDKNKADANINPKVLRLDADGNVLAQRQLIVEDKIYNGFILSSIGPHSAGLTVAGHLVGDPSTGCTVVLQRDLTVREATAYPGMPVHDILVYRHDRYIVSAYSNSDNACILISKGFIGSSRYRVVPGSANRRSVLCFGPESYFLSILNLTEGRLFSLDIDGHVMWGKKLRLGGNNLGVQSMSYHNAQNQVSFTTVDVNLLGLTKPDFKLCVTHPAKDHNFPKKPLKPFDLPVHSKPIEIPLLPEQGNWRKLIPHREPVCDQEEEEEEARLNWSRYAVLQSPHLYLQAAGSLGADSTKGIHLRWLLKRALANHLPKANYAEPSVNFNKPDDFVRIYRTPYSAHARHVSFKKPSIQHPYEWVYQSQGEAYYLYFLDRALYDQILSSFDPEEKPRDFLIAYGDGLLELEHKSMLAFAVKLNFEDLDPTSTIELELRSVEENKVTAPRAVTLRGRYQTTDLSGQTLFSENIRSIRFRATKAIFDEAEFEYYEIFLTASLENNAWSYLDKYALTKNQPLAFERLEPSPGDVHGNWLRYNDNAFVNINNYKKKWDSSSLPPENRILNTIDKYIDLSNAAANPKATELIFYNDPATAPIPGFEPDKDFSPSANQFKLSNLYVLQMAAMDYHIARMLGLPRCAY